MNATINDFIGKIVIYNANSDIFKMNRTSYGVTVYYVDMPDEPVSLEKVATFDERFN